MAIAIKESSNMENFKVKESINSQMEQSIKADFMAEK